MILPTVRDPRFITIRRGGTLTDSDHRLLALQRAMPHTLPAKPAPSHTSLRTNSVRPRTRSRPSVRPPRKTTEPSQGDGSVAGNVTGCRRRFVCWCSMTSGCATTSAGRFSTAEQYR